MVEDSKKRARTQRHTAPAHKGTRQQAAAAAAAAAAATAAAHQHGITLAASDQDAFAAFTSKYRDMLRFADADEAEAVYSMVSLTQAAHRQQQHVDIKGPVVEVPECRAVKRRPVPLAVPASSACSEGGRSDSSAKSAPGPTARTIHQHELWEHHGTSTQRHYGPSMLAAALGAAHEQHQQQPVHAAAGAYGDEAAASGEGGGCGAGGGDIHPGALGPMAGMHNMHMGAGGSMPMPMLPPFFPPGCMPAGMNMNMGAAAGAAAPGCMPPFMPPPWAMNPAAFMQSMMFSGLPMPPLPMPPPAGMQMGPFMPFMMQQQQGGGGGGGGGGLAGPEPAAGIPVCGPLPPAGNAFRAAAAGATAHNGSASKGAGATSAAGKQGSAAAAQAAPSTPAAAAGAATPQLRGCTQPASAGAAGASASPPPADLLSELEQLDVVSLRPWVLSHFCEDVYLMLLDAWRPDSSKVREAIWAWKLHIKGRRTGDDSAQPPDYKSFLVSLFGLQQLTQLTAAAAGGGARQGSCVLTKVGSSPAAADPAAAAPGPAQPQQQPAPGASACAAAGAGKGCAGAGVLATAVAAAATPELESVPCGVLADCDAACTTSNLSSEPGGAALTAPGPHVMNILVPAGSNMGGGASASATSPHKPAPGEAVVGPAGQQVA